MYFLKGKWTLIVFLLVLDMVIFLIFNIVIHAILSLLLMLWPTVRGARSCPVSSWRRSALTRWRCGQGTVRARCATACGAPSEQQLMLTAASEKGFSSSDAYSVTLRSVELRLSSGAFRCLCSREGYHSRALIVYRRGVWFTQHCLIITHIETWD